jgi:subtilisin family serine protease
MINFMMPLMERLRLKGSILVVAAGNDGIDLDTDRTRGLLTWFRGHTFQATVDGESREYVMDNIVVAASSDESGRLSRFSNYGRDIFIAPGENIRSCAAPPNEFDVGSGTSYAAAHVAGTLAKLMARYPSKTYSEIIECYRLN